MKDDNRAPRPGNLPDKPTLSVCMIVRNEEGALPRCLTSVQDVADEIIIVDTGSRDGTVAVAKDLGAKVFHLEWQDDFSLARNESLKHATGDWILQIDADEELLSESIPHLRKAMLDSKALLHVIRCDNGPESTIMRYHWFGRLFRRHPKIHYSRPCHEGVDRSAQRLIGEEPGWLMQGQPNVVIRHYGYSAPSFQDKVDRNLAIMESYLEEKPDDSYMLARLGNIHYVSGRFDEAERYLRKALTLDPSCSHANYFLALILMQREQLDEAIRYHRTAINNDPYLAEAYACLGAIYVRKKAFPLAIRELNEAIAIDANLSRARDLLVQAHGLLGGDYIARSMPDHAIAELKEALAIDAGSAIALSNLGYAYVSKGMYDEGVEALKQAIGIDPDLASARLNLGMAYAKQGMLDQALGEFECALAIDPEYSKAHHNLAVIHYKKGNHTEAIRHCDKALKLGAEIPPQFLEWLKPYRR